MSFTASIGCLLVIGSVCLHDLNGLKITDGGLFQDANIHGSGYDAVVELRSDYIPSPDWSRMSSICSDDICLSYFKHCQASTLTICDYAFSQPGDVKNTRVTIKATSRDALDVAESDFGAIAQSGGTATVFPFKRFTILSKETNPPNCSHRVPPSACLPPAH